MKRELRMALSIEHQEHGGYAVLAVHGDLDMATASQLTTSAMAVIEVEPRHLVIEASDIGFCDSSGIAAFVRIVGRLRPTGCGLGIAGARPIVRRVLQLSGLDEALVIADTVNEAAARLAGTPASDPS